MEDIDVRQVILYRPCWRRTEWPTRAGQRCSRADDIGATKHQPVDEQRVGDGEAGKLAGFAGMFFRQSGFARHDGHGNNHGEKGQGCAKVRGDDV